MKSESLYSETDEPEPSISSSTGINMRLKIGQLRQYNENCLTMGNKRERLLSVEEEMRV